MSMSLGLGLGLTQTRSARTGGVSQPIVLTSPSGTVFRTAEGRVLVRGTRTVTQEQSSG